MHHETSRFSSGMEYSCRVPREVFGLKNLVRLMCSMLLVIFLGFTSQLACAVNPAAFGIASHVAWRAFNLYQDPIHRIQLGDINVYYEAYGQGEPVILLHGGTGFVESMFAQVYALSTRYRVIVPDLRGHARTSDGAQPLSYGLMTEDVLRLMDALGIARAHIVGWSDGGVIGLNLAINHPNRVQKLVMISSNYQVNGLLPETQDMIQNLTPTAPFVVAQSLFYRVVASDPNHWDTLIAKIREMWLKEPNFSSEDLGKVQAPALVIVGENDMVNPRHCEEMAGLIPNATFTEVPGGTHSIPTERPNEVNQAIFQFLERS